MSSILKLVRRALIALWVMLLVGLVLLVAGAHVAPLVGRDIYIIRGGSMSPFVPLGSLVIDDRPAPADIRPGDIVTVRLHDAVVVTHRVVRVAELPAGLYLELKGDANAASDPALVPASNVAGRVVAFAPVAGFILAMLSLSTGLIAALSMLASLFLAIWLLENLEGDLGRQERLTGPVVGTGQPA